MSKGSEAISTRPSVESYRRNPSVGEQTRMTVDSSIHHTSSSLLLTAKQVAELLGISERHLHKLNSSGRLPRPVRLGRSVRWCREELASWVRAGSPDRARWESMQEKERR